MKEAIQEMDMIWQANGAFSSLDGRHIPIKCGGGVLEEILQLQKLLLCCSTGAP